MRKKIDVTTLMQQLANKKRKILGLISGPRAFPVCWIRY